MNLDAIMGRKSNCCGLSWFVNDGIGIGCAVFTYLLIAYAEFVVVFVMLLPEVVTSAAIGVFHAIAFTLLAGLALVAHSRAMCSDPVSLCGCSFTVSPVFSLCASLSFICMTACLL